MSPVGKKKGYGAAIFAGRITEMDMSDYLKTLFPFGFLTVAARRGPCVGLPSHHLRAGALIHMATPNDLFPGCAGHELEDGSMIFTCRLPDALLSSDFESLWRHRPAEAQHIKIHGRCVEIPRRQRAYGRDYQFSGQKAVAAKSPPELKTFLVWAQSRLEGRLNGILVNWYDGSLGNYIGPHHDDIRQLVCGTPIVTISLGEERIFRVSRHGKKPSSGLALDRQDFVVKDGDIIVIPWQTNLTWKHSVPRQKRFQGRRISITLRAFQ